jgi:hypothetical protein
MCVPSDVAAQVFFWDLITRFRKDPDVEIDRRVISLDSILALMFLNEGRVGTLTAARPTVSFALVLC